MPVPAAIGVVMCDGLGIDAYDVLGIKLDSTEEDIKKSYKKLSLIYHPDKVAASGIDPKLATEKFQKIKDAYDILQDAERKQLYDTFGIDLGEERPETEVWTIGLNSFVIPSGSLILKSILVRLTIWLFRFTWIGRLLMLCGIICLLLYCINKEIGGVQMRSEDMVSIFIYVGILDGVVILNWMWPLLADTMGVIYLSQEIVNTTTLLESWKIAIGSFFACLSFAWYAEGRWLWIVSLECLLCVGLLLALMVATCVMRLWIDSVQTQHASKHHAWRTSMRKERQRMQDELEGLKKKLSSSS